MFTRYAPRFVTVICTLGLVSMAPEVMAQAAPPEALPRIMVSGSGEAVAPAARAAFSIGIETVGATAAAAGSEAAQTSENVTAALRRAGLTAGDLKSTHLIVAPQWVYDDHTRQRRRTGFQALTTLMIDSASLDKLGAFVDAALSAGATTVSDPSFEPADENALRHQALTRAVQNTRGDAEVLAAAAGGTLGPLLQLSQGQASAPMPLMRAIAMAAPSAAAAPTNILPGDIHLSATVTGEWRFTPGSTIR